jgi:uncharacterized protein
MPIFVIFFVALYAGMNSYLFWKVHLAFPHMGRLHYVLAAGLLLMVTGPILVRLVDRALHPRIADAIGIVAYGWLAIVFWFFCLAVALDLWNLGVRGLSYWFAPATRLAMGPRLMLAVIFALVAGATVWSVWEANHIRLNAVTIRSDKLPPRAAPIRIAQISDMHLGGGTSNGRLAKALQLIEDAHPDLIVNTGDVLDSPYENLKDYAAMLAKVSAPLGKYSIPGNHEYYVGMAEAKKFNAAAGFQFLQGQSVRVSDTLWIAGADDPAGQYGAPAPPDPLPVPEQAGGRGFVLLLKHRPVVQADSPGLFDLQLSGHTHGGQIFPFSFVVAAVYQYDRGLFDLEKGSKLFVSRGTGTWGPPMRLGSAPEVTLITIEPAPPTAR